MITGLFLGVVNMRWMRSEENRPGVWDRSLLVCLATLFLLVASLMTGERMAVYARSVDNVMDRVTPLFLLCR